MQPLKARYFTPKKDFWANIIGDGGGDMLADDWLGVCMEEIIVVRAVDSDGTIFQTIMAALHDKSVQTVEVSSSILSFGDVELYPAFRRVLKAGKEIHLNYGEYSMLYCLVKHSGRVFTKDQLYASAWDSKRYFGSNTVETQSAVCEKSWSLIHGIQYTLRR